MVWWSVGTPGTKIKSQASSHLTAGRLQYELNLSGGEEPAQWLQYCKWTLTVSTWSHSRWLLNKARFNLKATTCWAFEGFCSTCSAASPAALNCCCFLLHLWNNLTNHIVTLADFIFNQPVVNIYCVQTTNSNSDKAAARGADPISTCLKYEPWMQQHPRSRKFNAQLH